MLVDFLHKTIKRREKTDLVGRVKAAGQNTNPTFGSDPDNFQIVRIEQADGAYRDLSIPDYLAEHDFKGILDALSGEQPVEFDGWQIVTTLKVISTPLQRRVFGTFTSGDYACSIRYSEDLGDGGRTHFDEAYVATGTYAEAFPDSNS